MITEAALAGQGVALGTPRLVARWLRSGALRRLFDIEAACPYAYFIVRRRKTELVDHTHDRQVRQVERIRPQRELTHGDDRATRP
jgi:DNA-binding transcriptional LysR family regulator